MFDFLDSIPIYKLLIPILNLIWSIWAYFNYNVSFAYIILHTYIFFLIY